ncbi:hypothetical protein SynRS9907_01967 [Synechococcus sp. RS9907]|nr:hypothetical protein SynRS9907_01967 [Synechococcus sp. RS9907]
MVEAEPVLAWCPIFKNARSSEHVRSTSEKVISSIQKMQNGAPLHPRL